MEKVEQSHKLYISWLTPLAIQFGGLRTKYFKFGWNTLYMLWRKRNGQYLVKVSHCCQLLQLSLHHHLWPHQWHLALNKPCMPLLSTFPLL